MSTIVTMTLDEIMRTPLTEEEIRTIRAAAKKASEGKIVEDPDCPIQTKEELAKFRPLKEARPELYKMLHSEDGAKQSADTAIAIDCDVLEWFKRQGKGYQTKINDVLRKYAFG